MKKIWVCSDSHLSVAALQVFSEAAVLEKPDLIVHLGDCTGDAKVLESLVGCPVASVAGNCDFGGERERIMEESGHRILCVHGHEQGVKSGLERLAEKAKREHCDVALFGHTHIPQVEFTPAALLLNPGSLARSKSESRTDTYCVLTVGEKILYEFREV